MIRRTALMLVVALVAAMVGSQARADVSLGDKAPGWEKLPGTDGKVHSLADLKDAKIIVVAFTCNQCPVSIEYEDRFAQFAKEYKAKGVEFIAIDSNGDTMEQMKARAEEKGFNFPYIADETQKVGKAYGAKVTPHIFILDKNRTVAYMGAFDNNKKGSDLVPYAKNAVGSLLEGKPVEEAKTKQFGCGIPYKN
jgi:peroxiredoxin